MDMKSTPIDPNSYCFVANVMQIDTMGQRARGKIPYKLLLYTNTFFDTHNKYVCDEGNENHFPHYTLNKDVRSAKEAKRTPKL